MCNNVVCKTIERKQRVLEHLKQKYMERDADFFFKSKHLARKINLDVRVIGRIVKLLVVDGFVKIWNDTTNQHERTYLTNFKKTIGE